ncbi:MAG: HDOD domain-containing protein [Sandaracinus sp.]
MPTIQQVLPIAATLRRRLERKIDELPVLPTVVAQLMALDPSGPHYFQDVERLIGSEPSFLARALSAANSASSAPRSPITTLGAAILRIGARNSASLVLSAAVTRVFVPRSSGERALWQHALEVATLARRLARHAHDASFAPEEAYAAGLLHDVGRFVMFQEAPAELERLDQLEWHSPEELSRHERAVFGLTHAEIGAMACARWSLPQVIVQVVHDHHHEVTGPRGRTAAMTAVVQIADRAMFASMHACDTDPAQDRASLENLHVTRAAPLLGLALDDFEREIGLAAAESQSVCEALGIARSPTAPPR